MVSTVFISFLALNTLFLILHTSASPLPSPDVAISRPPKAPICPEDLGPRPPRTVGFSRDCERAIASIPRDMRPVSPVRNFYLLTEHVDPTMPNVQLPFERESGETEKLDLAIYSKRSLFAATRRLRDSPGATTNVAEVEFLQLLGLLPGPAGSIRASLNETLVSGESCAGEGGANEEATTA
ncbi:MAG: hypothetical protein Q9172_002366 [Xanthocarpia lactea]